MQTRPPLIAIIALVSSPSAFAIDELPENLSNITLSEGLLDTVSEALPESQAVNEAFLNLDYDPNITLSSDAQMSITFVDEGAGYRNSLGYFNYEADSFSGLSFGDIDLDNSGKISTFELGSVEGVTTGMIFANASELGGGGQLLAGDTTVIGDGTYSWDSETETGTMSGGTVFDAGTTTGFFLAANAWTGKGVAGWDKKGSPNTFYTLDFLNQENDASATIDTAADVSRHTAMMFSDDSNDEIILGFEDLVRPYGDNDFNDAVFIVRTSPESALAGTNIPVAAAPAPLPGSSLLSVLVSALIGLGLTLNNTARKAGSLWTKRDV